LKNGGTFTLNMQNPPIQTIEVPINELIPADYNPRKHDEVATEQLKHSIKRFGLVDPMIVNSAPNRKNIIIGGHFRWEVAKELGYETIPVVYVDIPDLAKEKELNLRLNKNTGEFDWDLLAKFDESFLADVGFSSNELDGIFEVEGDVEFVKELYEDYKTNILTQPFAPTKVVGVPLNNITGQSISKEPSEAPNAKKIKNRLKESYTIVKDLDLNSKAVGKSLKSYFVEKKPQNGMENNAVFVYYLQKIANVPSITLDHMYTCYKDAGIKIPTALRQSLLDTAHRKGWIDTSDLNAVTISTRGENFVEHDLPRQDKENK
jgi:hypothetical protein